jgi:Gamma-glutamyltransferase
MKRRWLAIFGVVLAIPLHAARQPLRAKHGMVVAMESIAADVGVSVLQKGGNAVTPRCGRLRARRHPSVCRQHRRRRLHADPLRRRPLDVHRLPRARAGEKASRNMYLDAKGELTKDSIEGWRSSGVPGSVRGFEMAVTKYGKRTWAQNMAPAVELASKGFPVSYALAEGLKGSRSLASSPESKRIFQKNGAFYEVGETLVQPELAQTLNGSRRTGRTSSTKARPRSGLPTRCPNTAASSRSPISRTTRRSSARRSQAPTRTTRSSRPPSSSGGIALLEMLGILEGTGYEKAGAGSASAIHYEAEAMRRAYADRNEYVAIPTS